MPCKLRTKEARARSKKCLIDRRRVKWKIQVPSVEVGVCTEFQADEPAKN
jgi:hypothetical protein